MDSDSSMDICYIINQLAPDGAPTLIRDIIKNTEKRVTYTVCYLEGDDTLVSELRDMGARVVDFDANFKFDPRAFARMYRFFRTHEFDIIHSHLPYSQTVTRLAAATARSGTPLVSTQHNVRDNYHPITRTTERVTRSLDDATIAVSKGVQQSFIGSGTVYPSRDGKWTTIYNGLNVEQFNRAVSTSDETIAHNKYGVPKEGVVFLNVGRYTAPKAQLDLIDGFAEHATECSDSHLVIVGWGPLKSDLHSRARKHGVADRISITGRVPAIEPFYNVSDIFVSSSIREGLPFVLLEAMASKLPIIGTNIRGVREVIVEDKTGTLVPAKLPGSIAKVMTESMQDIDTWREYGEQGYKRAVERFSIETVVSKHLDLYRELIEETKST